MNRPLAGFEWDAGNIAKCLKHGVSLGEIEALFSAGITVFSDAEHSDTEPRLKAIGRTAQGRFVFLVYTIRSDRIRPISARYMHRREVLHYEKETSGI